MEVALLMPLPAPVMKMTLLWNLEFMLMFLFWSCKID